jgi:hypothetical protein
MPIASRAYRIDPYPDSGCTVVESFTDRRDGLMTAIGPIGRGVRDVPTHDRAGVERTLAAVRAAAGTATWPYCSETWPYSNRDGSPAPRRTISGSSPDRSTTVVGSVPQSP